MNRKISALAAGATLVFSLTACAASDPPKVSGNLDDVKRTSAVAATTKKVPKTKKVCTKRKNGVCKTSVTRPDGFKTETVKPAKPARRCVELDNVNNDPNRDDVWYEVDASTYDKWSGKTEGDPVKDMVYRREVTKC